MSLREYNRKRKFDETPEPPGKPQRRRGPLRFVVQLHRATRLHYDFRIEMGGSFKSWAVPRGPSLNPMDQRLAIFVEDHPIAYGSFEGIIPRGNYGAGTVMIWDHGTYEQRGTNDPRLGEKAMLDGLERGHMTFVLQGEKLRGEFALIRLNKGDERSWLLVKKRDEFSTYKIPKGEDRSVATGRTMAQIAAEAEGKGEIWLPKRTASIRKRPKEAPAHEKRTTGAPRPAQRAPSRPASNGPTPRRVLPMLPRLERVLPNEKGWLFCLLTGGLRAIAEVEPGRTALYSKRLLSFAAKHPRIIEALRRTEVRAVLDGEISSDGKYRVFDLLFVDGEDLRTRPLAERIAKLKGLRIFGESIELCKTADAVDKLPSSGSPGAEMRILARDATSEYRSGVRPEWIEVRGQVRATRAKPRRGPPSTEPGARRTAPRASTTHAERGPVLSNLEKLYWKAEGITKGDLIEYYRQVGSVLLPHLQGRPMSMHRFPGGIEAKGFYQKDLTGYKPRWVRTQRIFSESAGKTVDYVVCQNEWTLLYLANLGCIEMNPWLSRVESLERPDSLVIDLDPDRQTFAEVTQVALEVHRLLEKLGAASFCKTSGATGMHICVPLQARFDYELAREFAEKVCHEIQRKFASITTLERNPAKRGGRMYLDFMQNRIGQTLVSPYSVRPRPGAPVSTPLKWSEVNRRLDPAAFTMKTTLRRLERLGDLWEPMLQRQIDIARCLKKLN